MENLHRYFSVLAKDVIDEQVYSSTKIITEKLKITATRRRYKAYRKRLRMNHVEILFTIGKPNYKERELIKKAKRLTGSLPLRAIKKGLK